VDQELVDAVEEAMRDLGDALADAYNALRRIVDAFMDVEHA
jgi:hypothetical protein